MILLQFIRRLKTVYNVCGNIKEEIKEEKNVDDPLSNEGETTKSKNIVIEVREEGVFFFFYFLIMFFACKYPYLFEAFILNLL